MSTPNPPEPRSPEPPASGRWLVLLMQLPTRPSRARVQTWRRLQRLGAVALKSGAYVLPNTTQAREDFEWMKREILGFNGQASVFAAHALGEADDEAIVTSFREARRVELDEVVRALERLRRSLAKASPRRRTAPAVQAARVARRCRQRLEQIEDVDFFGAPNAGRARELLEEIEMQLDPKAGARPKPGTTYGGASGAAGNVADYRGRVWVTRPRPKIDRMSSAWLIRRFIDPDARFEFATALPATESERMPFDMFDAEFSHHGGACTFEVLAARFGIDDAAVAHIARIVHDVDLKDTKFGEPEAPTIAGLVEGLGQTYADDAELLEHGVVLFEGLYRSLTGSRLQASGSGNRTPGSKKR